jgi:hypothetical protein
MKKMLTAFALLLALFSNGQKINGIVIDIETNKALPNSNVYLLVRDFTKDTANKYYYGSQKFKILSTIKTDSLGKFRFENLTPGKYSVSAGFEMPMIKPINIFGSVQTIENNLIIKSNENYYKTLKLPVTCKYEKTSKQKFCPNCKKSNMVIPIEYGLSIGRYDSLGNSLDAIEEVYHGGCDMDMYCNPTKHCKRCKIQF